MVPPLTTSGAVTTARSRCRLVPAWIAVGALTLAPAAGHGYTWDYAPVVGTGLSYETNPDYSSVSSLEDDAYAAFLDATVNISAETGRSSVNLRPRLRGSLYAGAENSSDFNAIDYYVPLDAYWATRRLQYSLDAGYSRLNTRNSEVRVTDPNDSGQTGSSGRVVSVDEDQYRAYIAPSLAYQISPRDRFGLTLSLNDVRYTEAELTNRSDYLYGAVNASWTRAFGLKTRVSGSVRIDGFKAEQPGRVVENETISYGVDAGYEFALSDLTSVGITAGTSTSDIKVTGLETIDADLDPSTPPIACFDPDVGIVLCELQSNEKNFVGRAFVRQKNAETITTEFSISRSLQPNSDGAQVTHDSASAYISKDFTPRLKGSLGLNYIKQEAVGGDTAGSLAQRFDREYVRMDASLSRTLARTWFLDARYAYSHDEQKSGATYTTNNQIVSLQLRYAGLGRH